MISASALGSSHDRFLMRSLSSLTDAITRSRKGGKRVKSRTLVRRRTGMVHGKRKIFLSAIETRYLEGGFSASEGGYGGWTASKTEREVSPAK